MTKYLKVPVTALPNWLMSADNVAHVYSASATSTSTRVDYTDGSTTTITHDAQVGFNFRDALSDAMVASQSEAWTNVVYDVSMPAGVAISAITHA
mgnify:CR=1 FL=1|tara:strand:+ start:248 stop:532 length:285 start_codon:yes stop_codon:yes gene_type:complete